MVKPGISFFAINFIMLFLLVSLVLAVFELHRFVFVLELVFLLVLFFILAFAMLFIYNNRKWGWSIIGAALVLTIINLFFIFLLTGIFGTSQLTVLFFSLAGLAIAFMNLKQPPQALESKEEAGKSNDYYPYIDKMEPVPEEHIEVSFTPGKFVASRNTAIYHAAKCDWAKKISKSNQVWFNSEEEAKSKGFEADKCVS